MLTILILGLFILGAGVILQYRAGRKNLDTIKRLTQLIDQTNTELSPPVFNLEEGADPEFKKLAHSYNRMMAQRADNLRRARQFSADVTHELRTPLTILRGETELALRNERSREELLTVLESNLEEIGRMSYLIEDLLLLSKSDLGEIPLKMAPLSLVEFIIELHHQGQLLATAKNIRVDLICPDQQITLNADSLRLRQVFLNLITNAIKYTPEGGSATIEVRVNENNHTVAITVSDTGIGIDNEHQDAIFDRFYRVDKTRNRNDGGSGLGLSIVKWIVNAHAGTITVNSKLGQGSKFTVTLPCTDKN